MTTALQSTQYARLVRDFNKQQFDAYKQHILDGGKAEDFLEKLLKDKSGFAKEFNPDQPRDENGRWAGGDALSGLVNQAIQGGFSYNPSTHSAPKTGFMVARVGTTVDVPAGSIEEATNGLHQFLTENADMFKNDPNLYIGGWVDNGRLFIEPSDNVESVYQAEQLGIARDQIAIWDVTKGEAINTGGSGGAKAREGSNDPNFGKALHGISDQLGINDSGRAEGMVQGLSGEIWNVLLKYSDDQPRDESGRWTSGGGSGGSSSETSGSNSPRELAKSVYEKAKSIEPKVTADMQSLADKHGAELHGLEYRLKTEDSLQNKIELDAKDKGSYQEATRTISDANRYTMVTSPENYISMAEKVTNDLRSQGYEVDVKNYWTEGSNYKGINAALIDQSGNRIELQFHTQDSLDVKMQDNHVLYKEYQKLDKSNPEAQALNDKMIENANTIPHPPNVQSFGRLKIGKSLNEDLPEWIYTLYTKSERSS